MIPPVGTLEAVRRILGQLVLAGASVRVADLAPDAPPRLAIVPAGVITDEMRCWLGNPIVRREIARHLELGAVRFGHGAPDGHSRVGTAAGFAHVQLCLLTLEQRDRFEERAAIREHDGRIPRRTAELFALFDVLDNAAMIEAVVRIALLPPHLAPKS